MRACEPSPRPHTGARLARWTCAALFAAVGALGGWVLGCFATLIATTALDVYPDDPPYQWVGAMVLGGGLTAAAAALLTLRFALRRLPLPGGRSR